MRKILAALTLFAAFAAFAAEQKHTWFDLDVDQIGSNASRVWPTDGSNYLGHLCVVTNTTDGGYSEGRIAFNTQTSVIVIPDAGASIYDDNYVSNAMSVKLDPFTTPLPELPEDLRMSVIAVDCGQATNLHVAIGGALAWTNTGVSVAAGAGTNAISVVIRQEASGETWARWRLNGAVFDCCIPAIPALQGVTFFGSGEIHSCFGDVFVEGNPVTFWLADLPPEISVSITNASGMVRTPDAQGRYTYGEYKYLYITYTLTTNGWSFLDGKREWDEEFRVMEGEHVAQSPYDFAITDSSIGPTNGWNVIMSDGNACHYAGDDVATALAESKHGSELMAFCHSVEPEITYTANSITIDGEMTKVKDHYHYQKYEEEYEGASGIVTNEIWLLEINAEEASLTGFCATNSLTVTIGSFSPSFSGFNYSVVYGDDPAITENAGETVPVAGNGGKLELVAPKGEGASRFFRIKITD